MYVLKLFNSNYHMYRQIVCQDHETALKISTDLKVSRFVISQLIVDDQGRLTREVVVYVKK